jgi:predicted nucleic acid-binding protein
MRRMSGIKPGRKAEAGLCLVDTSVWIEFFRIGGRLQMTDYLEISQIVICPPIFQEILQGIRDKATFQQIRANLEALRWVDSPMELARYEEAAQLYRLARRAGKTPRSSIDCLIAASALRHNLTVLHIDRDFTALAECSPLKARALQA